MSEHPNWDVLQQRSLHAWLCIHRPAFVARINQRCVDLAFELERRQVTP